jgi:hypothetical protein
MGWPSDRPQTPENILPYVSEEAEELLEQLQQAPVNATPVLGQMHRLILTPGLNRDRPVTDYHLLADLLAACLWGITASSYEAMRLLEGVTAAVPSVDSESWQGVRLLPCLCFESPTLSWTLDIVTQAPVVAQALEGKVQVALTVDDLDPQPRPVHQWLQLLWQAIDQCQSPLRSLRQGWDVALLLPQQPWHQGRLSLDLRLVGLPQVSDGNSLVPPMTPALPGAEPALPAPPHLNTLLQFTDPAWVTSFNDQVLSALPLPNTLNADPLLTLVTAAQAAMERTQSPGPLAPALATSVMLQHLWPRWRWLALQPDTPLMQLMGGVPTACLSAHQTWTAGTLQAGLSLKLRQGETHWQLDLGTGTWRTPSAELPPGTLLMLPEGGPWATQIWPWEALKAELIAALEQGSPAFRLLRAGTMVILNPGLPLTAKTDPQKAIQETDTPVQIGLQLEITFQPRTPVRSSTL